MRGLSPNQIVILQNIAARTPSDSARNGVAVWAPSRGHNYNIPIGSPGLDHTASERAVLSRALARLEARGLVERLSGYEGNPRGAGRTHGVRLTALGRTEVQRLTKTNDS